MNRTALFRTTMICVTIAGTTLLIAGPLDPPTGPIAGTYKTLAEVEPRTPVSATTCPGDADSIFRITQPGSYYLTGNITGVAGKHGIEIAVSGVTLDLNGFELAGVPAMGAFDGVTVSVAGLKNIAVVNGSVRDWGNDGVNLGAATVAGCRVEAVLSSGNPTLGIWAGSNARVFRCSVSGGQYGISTRQGCTVSECSVTGTTHTGIVVNTGSTASNCSAYANLGTGFEVSVACTVANCTSYNNTGIGISAGASTTLSNCQAYSNTASGIVAGQGCTLTNCSTYGNSGSGIGVSAGSTVTGCSATSNVLDGVLCDSGCTIRACTCANNGNSGNGAGIHATGANNRIEGNNCSLADRGIQVGAARNIIVRNSCSGNTVDWNFVAGNVFGPIVDRTAPGSGAVNGFTATGSMGTTDPNANVSY